MIFDCFSFFNELDLLEIRLNVLKDVVDKFVLVEATRTHTGKPKPLYYEENKERYVDFADRIIHVVVDDFRAAEQFRTERQKAWARENIQRNSIIRGLSDAKDADIIIISDLDEIPKPEAVIAAARYSGITRIGMRLYYYYLNYRNCSVNEWRLGTQVLRYCDFVNADIYKDFKFDQFVLKDVNPMPSATMIRFRRSNRVIKDGGWHFSYLGGIASIKSKLESFAHTEFGEKTKTELWIRDRINKGEDIFLRGDKLFVEEIDGTYPGYVVANRERLGGLLLAVSEEYVRRTRFKRMRCRLLGRVKALISFLIPDFLVPFALKVRDVVHGVRATKERV